MPHHGQALAEWWTLTPKSDFPFYLINNRRRGTTFRYSLFLKKRAWISKIINMVIFVPHIFSPSPKSTCDPLVSQTKLFEMPNFSGHGCRRSKAWLHLWAFINTPMEGYGGKLIWRSRPCPLMSKPDIVQRSYEVCHRALTPSARTFSHFGSRWCIQSSGPTEHVYFKGT